MFVHTPRWHPWVVALLWLALCPWAWGDVTNGGFETGSAGTPPPNWQLNTYLNPGVTIPPTPNRANLNLLNGGVPATWVLSAPSGSQTDANMGSIASLRWPWRGNQTVQINAGVTNKNVNGLRQTFTVSESDIDPRDGHIHLRGVLAPVFEEGSHTADQEQYVFLQATNLTTNTLLHQRFIQAHEGGVPWKTSTTNGGVSTYAYTDWQLFDIDPGNQALRPGDTVQLEVLVAACAAGGHQGYAYLDSVGTDAVSGLSIVAQGPANVAPNTDLTYRYTVLNHSASMAQRPDIQITLPPNTSYTSLVPPAGYTCTTPTPGAGGSVRCQGSALPPEGVSTLSLTVHLSAGASGAVTHGDYRVNSDTDRSALGPPVLSTISPTATLVGLTVSVSNGRTQVLPGQAQSYAVRIRNEGPATAQQATVSVPAVADLLDMAWTCAATGGSTCQDASGQGAVASAATLPAGSEVVYTVTGTVSNTPTGTQVSLAASVHPAELDSQPLRNADADTDPVAIDGACDPTTHLQMLEDSPTQGLCTRGNASAVTLSDTTYLWSCLGTGGGATASCQATHAHPVTPVTDLRGTWSPASTQWVLHGQTLSFTLSPARGQALTSASGCQGSLNGNGYTTGAITAACSVTAQWVTQTYPVGGTLSGLAASTSVTLRNNAEVLTLSQNGSFVFPTPVAHGATYSVDVMTAPPGQTCTVSPAHGTVDAAAVSNLLVTCAATPPVVTRFTGTSPTGSGTVTADLSGPAGCGFATSSLTNGSASGLAFPHGLFQFTTNAQCAGTVTLTLTYPQPLPPQTRYWKWGPTADQPAAHWYTVPAMVNGRTVTYSVVDGGLGDDDLSANGTIADPGGPAVAADSVPTLSGLLTAALAVGVLALGAWGSRPPRRTSV
jgi:hypothetical protein